MNKGPTLIPSVSASDIASKQYADGTPLLNGKGVFSFGQLLKKFLTFAPDFGNIFILRVRRATHEPLGNLKNNS